MVSGVPDATIVGYAVSPILLYSIVQRRYPIPYPTGRLLAGSGGTDTLVDSWGKLAPPLRSPLRVGIKLGILALLPVSFILLDVITRLSCNRDGFSSSTKQESGGRQLWEDRHLDGTLTARPWASICIATYKRLNFLRTTLQSVRQQTMFDFEVIVADNDPEGSALSIVAEIADSRIRYLWTGAECWGDRGLNRAMREAWGMFTLMLSDDDIIYPHMLATLRELSEMHPQYGAYYGAVAVYVDDLDLACSYGLQVGATPSLAPGVPKDGVRCFSAAEFPRAYFSHQVFPYVFWSVGVARTSIVQQVGGIPDYGWGFFTDFGYIRDGITGRLCNDQ